MTFKQRIKWLISLRVMSKDKVNHQILSARMDREKWKERAEVLGHKSDKWYKEAERLRQIIAINCPSKL